MRWEKGANRPAQRDARLRSSGVGVRRDERDAQRRVLHKPLERAQTEHGRNKRAELETIQ